VLEVLHPFEVGDHDAAGVRELPISRQPTARCRFVLDPRGAGRARRAATGRRTDPDCYARAVGSAPGI
jgi:hypothetical protein